MDKIYGFFKNKKVLVTGAGGFIGSHLAEKLVEIGASVDAMVHYNALNSWGNLELCDPEKRKALNVVLGDVSDPFFMNRAVKGKDVVFHLAALIGIPYSYVAPQQYVATNIQGTVNVLEAVRNNGIAKMVHTSTSEAYGTAIYTPIDEKHPLQGQSPYSASKIAADMMAESYFRSFETPVAVCRPFNTYGPRQSSRAVIPTMIIQLLRKNKKLKLGLLDTYRDFNFVADTVDGFLAVGALEKTAGQVINLASGRTVTIQETLEKLMTITGVQVEVEQESARIRPDKSEVMKLQGDARKALELIGWTSRVSLEEGLKVDVEWYMRHLDRYKGDMYHI